MNETLDLICPKCKQIINNICLKIVDWMLIGYCSEYINHYENCEQ